MTLLENQAQAMAQANDEVRIWRERALAASEAEARAWWRHMKGLRKGMSR